MLLLACARPTSDATVYAAALHSGACETVRVDTLRDDCWLGHLDVGVPDFCDRLTTPALRGECAFQVAERTHDPAHCADAGPYVDDCRLHLLAQALTRLEGGPGGEADEEAARVIAAGGLSVDDFRAWTAWYRAALLRQSPLDRSACDAVGDLSHRETCRAAGLVLYNDRLNNERDRHEFPCDGGPLPPFLQYTPDPELDLVVKRRRPEFCPA